MDYGFISDGERRRGDAAIAENRAAAKLRLLKSKQRLTDQQVGYTANKVPGLELVCDVTRVHWQPTANGVAAKLQANPCNGGRANAFECCYLCSQWFQAHEYLLREWFSLAVTVDFRIARYFTDKAKGLRSVFPELPFE